MGITALPNSIVLVRWVAAARKVAADDTPASRWRCRTHRLADRLGIGGIVLVALDVRLHITRRHQPYFVAQLDQLACPVMGSGAGLHADETRPQPGEELQHPAT